MPTCFISKSSGRKRLEFYGDRYETMWADMVLRSLGFKCDDINAEKRLKTLIDQWEIKCEVWIDEDGEVI